MQQGTGDSQILATKPVITRLICTRCEKGYGLNMVGCLFATDVITQNSVCRHRFLALAVPRHTHIIPALSHTNVLCLVHKMGDTRTGETLVVILLNMVLLFAPGSDLTSPKTWDYKAA